MIIGVVGPLGSGKDEVATYLVSRGAKHISLSSEILKEIKKRKIPVTRKAYVDVANDLREKISHGVLVERAFANPKDVADFTVVSSIRHPAEAGVVLKYPNSHILAVIAPQRVRFARINARAKKGDIKTWNEILEYDREALKGKNPAHQQITACLRLADIIVRNNGTKRELRTELDRVLKKISK